LAKSYETINHYHDQDRNEISVGTFLIRKFNHAEDFNLRNFMDYENLENGPIVVGAVTNECVPSFHLLEELVSK